MTRLALVLLLLLGALHPDSADAKVSGAHWPHHPHQWPVVYVENHARDSWWHVGEAVHEWGSGLRLGRCRPGAGCLVVHGHERHTPWLGTTWEWTRPGHPDMYGQRIGIYLNKWRIPFGDPRLYQATLHELGRGLGLDVDNVPTRRRAGCMTYVDHGRNGFVSSFERRELHRIYGIRGT